MKVFYDEQRRYVRLNSLERGQFARTPNNEKIFGCLQIPRGGKLIFELTDLGSQYFDQIDLNQKVYVIEQNERLIIRI
jgi:hypothetical protein